MFTALSPMSNIFYSTMIMSTLMAVSSNNWLMTWAALEINMLSFIPLINMSNKFQESEAMLKYFLAQALGSSLLLASSTCLWNNLMMKETMIMMLISSMMIKLGMVPYHFWFPSVMTSISWTSCFILSTWQKIAPMSILAFMLSMYSSLTVFICSINAIIGSLLGMNQTKMKSIMAASSITHMGWMYSLTVKSMPTMTITYLLLYSIIIMPMFMFMNKLMTTSAINNLSLSKSSMIFITLLLLSLGGLPPMMGFFPKLMTIYMLNCPTTIMMLLVGALINLFFYLNILFMMSTNISSTNSMTDEKTLNTWSLMLATTPLPLMLLLMIYAMTMLNKS